MNQKPYHSYHGRRSLGQRILMGIAIVLAVVLLLGVVALFVYYNNFDFRSSVTNRPKTSAQPDPIQSGDDGEEPIFVIEDPDDNPDPDPYKLADDVDLSFYVSREVPMGLALYEEGKAPTAGQGVIFTLGQTGGLTRKAASEQNYVAVYLTKDEQKSDTLVKQCLTLADKGADEIILADVTPAQTDGADLAKLYREVKTALDEAGWKGRLGLVLDQNLTGSRYHDDLVPAIAQSFERLYFRSGLRDGVRNTLIRNGFSDSYADIVTVVRSNPGARYSWAVLPD